MLIKSYKNDIYINVKPMKNCFRKVLTVLQFNKYQLRYKGLKLSNILSLIFYWRQ